MISINPINTALSGIRAHSKALNAQAENIANVNTEDFRAIEAIFEEEPAQGVNVRLQRDPADARRGTRPLRVPEPSRRETQAVRCSHRLRSRLRMTDGRKRGSAGLDS